MRSIESEGETIDEAIEKALQTLRVGREQVEVEILAGATRGVFGFGGKKARVRATVRAPLVTRLEEGDRRPAPSDPRETPLIPSPSSSAPSIMAAVPAGSPPSDAVLERCRDLVVSLISHLGVSCTVRARPGEEAGVVVLEISGDSGGLLIGRRGATLDAIEYVVNRIIGREEETAAGRVIVDVEGYRERRREYLTALAHRLAEKVKQSGHVVTLNPMSPRDRRVVHIALQGDTVVATRSQGEGHFRKILIVPVERPHKSPRQSRPPA
jgi:spoIIIJ-associated protein